MHTRILLYILYIDHRYTRLSFVRNTLQVYSRIGIKQQRHYGNNGGASYMVVFMCARVTERHVFSRDYVTPSFPGGGPTAIGKNPTFEWR